MRRTVRDHREICSISRRLLDTCSRVGIYGKADDYKLKTLPQWQLFLVTHFQTNFRHTVRDHREICSISRRLLDACSRVGIYGKTGDYKLKTLPQWQLFLVTHFQTNLRHTVRGHREICSVSRRLLDACSRVGIYGKTGDYGHFLTNLRPTVVTIVDVVVARGHKL